MTLEKEPSINAYLTALSQFRQARRRAWLEEVLARLQGRSPEAWNFEEIRQLVGARQVRRRERRTIPLDAIVGSVGRYSDFTRSFLPRRDSARNRWIRVQLAANGLEGLPPIEVYQIGQVYFVQDGNHRVSVARALGATHMDAYVTEIETKAPLSPEDDLDAIILKAEYAAFLEYTEIDRLIPDHGLEVTVPGKYPVLAELIDIHHYYMSREAGAKIPYDQAVVDWYRNDYLPMVDLIRRRGLLRDFPRRTETDLYVWIMSHRAEISREVGWTVPPQAAAAHLQAGAEADASTERGRGGGNVLAELLDGGPPVGSWRGEWLPLRSGDRLFEDLVVAVVPEESGWWAVDWAVAVAAQEEGRVHGLHLVDRAEERQGPDAQALREAFAARCVAAGVDGELRIRSRNEGFRRMVDLLVDRARWADLVVFGLRHPPAPGPLARLGSGVRRLLYRSPRPVLAVLGPFQGWGRLLLAYDGSPKAEEALFVAQYMGARWGLPVTVLCVADEAEVGEEMARLARSRLESQGCRADWAVRAGSPAQAILDVAEEHRCGLILMGGYGAGPLRGAVMGSTVDEVLRRSRLSVLICR